MTRLEEALQQLTPAQVDELLVRAQQMLRENQQASNRFLQGNWAGCIKSSAASGLEAQQETMHDWRRSLERGLSS